MHPSGIYDGAYGLQKVGHKQGTKKDWNGPIEIEQFLTKSNVITEMAERIAAPTIAYERRETCQLLSKRAELTLRTHRYKAALEACVR